jgi:hypothetical protein
MAASKATLAVLTLAAAVVAAQETPRAAEEQPAPRPSIRVLQNPYDISSFYRSGESPLGPWAGLPADPAYRISDFYRSHQGGYPGGAYGWSGFWTNGYRAPRPAPMRPYRRSIFHPIGRP